MSRTVLDQGIGHRFDGLHGAYKTNLHRFWLHVVHHSLHLPCHYLSGQVVELLDAERRLHRHTGDGRHGIAAQSRYGLDIGLNA